MNIQTRPEIEKQRDILDRRALTLALTRRWRAADPHADTAAVGAVLREHLAQGRAEINRRFEADPRAAESGRRLARETCFMIDQLIRAIYDFTTKLYPLANPSAAEKIALVAVGGYGRAELAPYSDIDLLFLLPYKLTPHCEQVVEYILYRLWDLGLKVGQSARSIDECLGRAKGDLTIQHQPAGSALPVGRAGAVRQVPQALPQGMRGGAGRSLLSGQAEGAPRSVTRSSGRRATRSSPTSRKAKAACATCRPCAGSDGSCMARIRSTSWSTQGVLTHEAAHRFDKAEAYLWILRCHLHYLRERAEDKLTFDIQLEIARRLGYRDHAGNNAVERLMKHYFLTAK